MKKLSLPVFKEPEKKEVTLSDKVKEVLPLDMTGPSKPKTTKVTVRMKKQKPESILDVIQNNAYAWSKEEGLEVELLPGERIILDDGESFDEGGASMPPPELDYEDNLYGEKEALWSDDE